MNLNSIVLIAILGLFLWWIFNRNPTKIVRVINQADTQDTTQVAIQNTPFVESNLMAQMVSEEASIPIVPITLSTSEMLIMDNIPSKFITTEIQPLIEQPLIGQPLIGQPLTEQSYVRSITDQLDTSIMAPADSDNTKNKYAEIGNDSQNNMFISFDQNSANVRRMLNNPA